MGKIHELIFEVVLHVAYSPDLTFSYIFQHLSKSQKIACWEKVCLIPKLSQTSMKTPTIKEFKH